MSYQLTLPWPPSINHYYANAKRGKFMGRMIGAAGQAYRVEVLSGVRAGHRRPPMLTGRLSVAVLAQPPTRKVNGHVDNSRRDLDNVWKCLLDALTNAGVWADDSQIDELYIVRAPKTDAPTKGRVKINVVPYESVVGLARLAEWE